MTILAAIAHRPKAGWTTLGFTSTVLGDGRVVVAKSVAEDGPFGNSDLQPGQEILSINGTNLREYNKLRGVDGYETFLTECLQEKMVTVVAERKDTPLSLELVGQARRHILFLRSLHRNGITLAKPSDESFRRYVDLWLPMVALTCCHTDVPCKLIPPGDIAWLWHCHRLAPYRYLGYVQERFFGKKLAWSEDKNKLATELPAREFLDAQYPFAFQLVDNSNNATVATEEERSACKESVIVFREMYPNERFFLDDSISMECSSIADKTLGGFDLVESCQRQSTFLWQVSGARFSDDLFLKQGADNYARFIVLRKLKRHKYVVPTYQIDLMWHTHMLQSIHGYHAVNMRVNGWIMNHDDTLNDRTEGGDLDTNYRATCQLWYEVYHEQYPVPGGMYRGEPPEEFFRPGWVNHVPMPAVNPQNEVTWMALDDSEAFRPASPDTGHVNANPPLAGYVFGEGAKGIGFYNIHTRQSYNILAERIEHLIQKRKARYESELRLLLASLVGIPCIPFARKSYRNERQTLDDAQLLALMTRDAPSPNAEIRLPAELERRLSRCQKLRYANATYHAAEFCADFCRELGLVQ